MAIDQFGGADRLQAVDVHPPEPGPGELRVRVMAAGINPVDCAICEGRLADRMPHAFPLIPGWDVAGVVDAMGPGVTRFRKGEKVWGHARLPTVQWGCYAESVNVPETSLATMPDKLLFEEAAAVPVAGLSAWQALAARGGVSSGHTVLVLGGAGGVGHLAIQLARNAGARTLATAAAADLTFLEELGVSAAIDEAGDMASAVRRLCPDGVDRIVDTLGGEGLQACSDAVRSGGHVTSMVAVPHADALAAREVTAACVEPDPSGLQLTLLAQMADRNRLRPHVQRMFPLAEAADAHELLASGAVRGKLVLTA